MNQHVLTNLRVHKKEKRAGDCFILQHPKYIWNKNVLIFYIELDIAVMYGSPRKSASVKKGYLEPPVPISSDMD